MNKSFFIRYLVCLIAFSQSALGGISVSEKLTLLENTTGDSNSELSVEARLFNESIIVWNRELKELHCKAFELESSGRGDEVAFYSLIEEIRKIKKCISDAQQLWANHCREEGPKRDNYALWHHPDGTVYDLIVDYGGNECVYIIPPHIGKRKISLVSQVPVPAECQEEFLYLILAKSGIAVQTVSPLIKRLAVCSETASLNAVVSDSGRLELLRDSDHVCYVFSSANPDIQTDWLILRKFINEEVVHSEIIAGKLFLFGTVGEIKEILKLYDFVGSDCSKQDFRLVTLNKIEASEMKSILKAAFCSEVPGMKNSGDDFTHEGTGLKVIPLQSRPDTLFLTGNSGEVRKAFDLIRNLENGLETPGDKVVFWYNVKHSDPEELAGVLSQVYNVLSVNGEGSSVPRKTGLIVPGVSTKTNAGNSSKSGNFIVDLKTGTLIIVVEKETLPHIKALLKKLDVSKKMVQIEVLLFERKLVNQHKSGLNLLRLGEEVCKKSHSAALNWNATGGILEFLVGGKGNSVIPGYDVAYQFLLAQEDIQINASPSIITMNQTPATISIVEEMSIIISADKDNKTQYNRAQYGITIKILPTVNIGENNENEEGRTFITLDTDIMFDTTGKNPNDRPDVTRRQITNHVRIADGETVILGGLRRKNSSDGKDGIPFLGEIPGIGKLFSMSNSVENSTEMFIFITPKILQDEQETKELRKVSLLTERPGDSAELTAELQEAYQLYQRRRLAEEAKKTALKLTGIPVAKEGEYDGR